MTVGSFIRIGPGIEEGEPSLCGGAPSKAVIPGGILKCWDPACTVVRISKLILREGPRSQGASWAVCGSRVLPYEFLNLYGVF
jgi:hypothetical protein